MECTKRFMIEPSLMCNIKCKFCYHLHRYDTWKDTVKTFDEMKKQIDDGKARGNEWMDITGGEPTIYLHILEIVKYAKSIGLKVCIITNGLVGEKKTNELLDVGIDEFLISRHGMGNAHNKITNTNNAYSQQVQFLMRIKGKVSIRFNCVITRLSQSDIEKIAYCLAEWEPKIINFINFNPHSAWKQHESVSESFIADLKVVEPNLNKAIEYLENKNIGVNVRYYPMCCIDEKYRRCICNDLQVMFDPYEWDYCTLPKTIERFYEWGLNASNANEEKGEPCNSCGLQNVCGGINKFFHKVSNYIYEEVCKPVENFNKIDYTYYRKENKLCL